MSLSLGLEVPADPLEAESQAFATSINQAPVTPGTVVQIPNEAAQGLGKAGLKSQLQI